MLLNMTIAGDRCWLLLQEGLEKSYMKQTVDYISRERLHVWHVGSAQAPNDVKSVTSRSAWANRPAYFERAMARYSSLISTPTYSAPQNRAAFVAAYTAGCSRSRWVNRIISASAPRIDR